MNKDLLAHILSELRQEFEALYGDRLAQMILYGSQARGDARPDSDIDVLVVLRGEVNYSDEIRYTSAVVSELCLKYEVYVACLFMSQPRFQHSQIALLHNIRREGMII